MTASARQTRSLVVEKELRHPPEKAWRALTEGALIGEWLMANDFEPVVGHKFNLRSAAMAHWDGIIACEVLAVEPPRRLAYSWNALGLESVVTFTHQPTAGGVLLRMEQSGFRPDQDANYKGANYGWQRFLAALEGVVARLP